MEWNDLTDPSGYQRRKEGRREHYRRFVEGWKLVKCTACNGSGYYDHNGSPLCGGCDGTGKDRISPDEYRRMQEYEKEHYRNTKPWRNF